MTTRTRRAMLPPFQERRPATGLAKAALEFAAAIAQLGQSAVTLGDLFRQIAQVLGTKRYRSQRPFRHYVER